MAALFYMTLAMLQLSIPLTSAAAIFERATAEVIPRPSLPSLASLGLTSAQLYAGACPFLSIRLP